MSLSFKGFKQVFEDSYSAESGFIYFVRDREDSGKTNGYLVLNGKKYGGLILL